MGKELAIKEQAQLPSTELNDWGAPNMKSSDVVLAKILPMQASSVLVTDGKATMGEFRDSLSGVKMGSIAEPIEVVPFHVEKYWDIMEQEGENFKWKRSMPLIEDPTKEGYNDGLAWEGEDLGVPVRRVRRMNFYVMLPSEIAAGTSLPYIFSFKSTSYREGRKLWTQMYVRNYRAKLAPCGYTIKIGGKKEKNEHGVFIIPNYELGRRINEQEYAECKQWFSMVKKGGVVVDESDVTGAADAAEVMASAARVEPEGTGAF